MNEERIIENLIKTGYSKEKAEEIFDFYLSIDCADYIHNLMLVEMISPE